VQETLAKAYLALGSMTQTPPLRPWLFRIAHNAAMDFLKRYERKHVDLVADLPEVIDGEEGGIDPALVEAALVRFVALPALQRSALVLKDVLGHSLAETAATMGTSVSAVKAALVRARANVARTKPPPGGVSQPPASPEQRRNFERYAELFNNRDWDALRALMSEQSRLDVVTRTRRRGAAAAEYYVRYADIARQEELRAEAGWVDAKPVIALFRPASSTVPAYFVLIEWSGDKVALIRDFRYVPYIAENARYLSANSGAQT
ncbi:MAG TPA: sigma factor-like helix-turn-helix DNA-binding protein, partial [Polyangiaceae bacterium]